MEPYERSFVETLRKRLREPGPLIQVLLGPRQVGKTFGTRQLKTFEKDLHYATADEALGHGPEWIDEQWQRAKQRSSHPILILDEIQKVMDWSQRIKTLWDREKKSQMRLVLLGSSSLSFHEGTEESLTGRFEVTRVPHWGFHECQEVFQFTLDEYLYFGGYPESARFKEEPERWRSYLINSIIETVIGKDILRNRSVKNPALFRQSFEIISSYPAREISLTKLLGQIQNRGNVEVVKHYLKLFEGAFLFRVLSKYSGSVIRQKSSTPKILPMCPALSSYRFTPEDLKNAEVRGRIFEAAVGAVLARLPGQLYYWRESSGAEVDFVYVDGKKIFAIEVKSGRRKSSQGVNAFQKQYPKAALVFIGPEEFLAFSRDPGRFLE